MRGYFVPKTWPRGRAVRAVRVYGNHVEVDLETPGAGSHTLNVDLDQYERIIGAELHLSLYACKAGKREPGRIVRAQVYERSLGTVELAGWLYPDCPPHLVRDHLNGDALDNRPQNIALVTRTQNALNNWKRRDGGHISENKVSKVVSFRVPRSSYDLFKARLDEAAKEQRYGVYSVIADALGVDE